MARLKSHHVDEYEGRRRLRTLMHLGVDTSFGVAITGYAPDSANVLMLTSRARRRRNNAVGDLDLKIAPCGDLNQRGPGDTLFLPSRVATISLRGQSITTTERREGARWQAVHTGLCVRDCGVVPMTTRLLGFRRWGLTALGCVWVNNTTF